MLALYLLVMTVALGSTYLILWRLPLLHSYKTSHFNNQTLSIIIPARNEEDNLAILLQSLKEQTYTALEIIVVDDESEDQTAKIARQFGTRLISFDYQKIGWRGKSAACWAGALEAKGDILLFLDADIFLAHPDSLARIKSAYQAQSKQDILSIQPYHSIQMPYENFSALFNIIVLAGMNTFSPFQDRLSAAGAFGPSLMIRRHNYLKAGGHRLVKEAIVENVELGRIFIDQGHKVRLYGGQGVLHFRMYPYGLASLGQGWAKSFASASQASHPLIIIGIVCWIAGAFVSFLAPLYFLWQGQPWALMLSLLGYLAFALHTYRLARLAGNFSLGAILIYPLLFTYFVGLFSWSFIQTFILKRLSWKGRDMDVL